ncbi:hypothetical protein P4200_19115 [Pseudomonas aeruginosa]|nr:hypothetical protein [Pseudomonas aeruginosa]
MSTAVEIACRDGVRLAGDHFRPSAMRREHRGGLRARRQARLLPALRRPGRGFRLRGAVVQLPRQRRRRPCRG